MPTTLSPQSPKNDTQARDLLRGDPQVAETSNTADRGF